MPKDNRSRILDVSYKSGESNMIDLTFTCRSDGTSPIVYSPPKVPPLSY